MEITKKNVNVMLDYSFLQIFKLETQTLKRKKFIKNLIKV